MGDPQPTGRGSTVATVLRWAALYFAAVFGTGFVLGPLRVLWLEPRLGVRAAELLEAPFMLSAIVLAGRWAGGRLRRQTGAAAALGVGITAASLVLAADLAVGIGLRGMTWMEVFTSRDPVSGPVYYALVAFTAAAPWMFWRRGA